MEPISIAVVTAIGAAAPLVASVIRKFVQAKRVSSARVLKVKVGELELTLDGSARDDAAIKELLLRLEPEQAKNDEPPTAAGSPRDDS